MIISKTVKQWFVYASRDLLAAKNTLAFSTDHKHIAAFLAQQCAEKAIKGFLVFHQIRFRKTHDFKELAKLVGPADEKLAKLVLKRKNMIHLAITYRYPDAELVPPMKPLTLGETRAAIKHAEQMYHECHRRVYGAK